MSSQTDTLAHDHADDDDEPSAVAFFEGMLADLHTLVDVADPADHQLLNAIRLVIGYVATERVTAMQGRCPDCGGPLEPEDDPGSGETLQ